MMDHLTAGKFFFFLFPCMRWKRNEAKSSQIQVLFRFFPLCPPIPSFHVNSGVNSGSTVDRQRVSAKTMLNFFMASVVEGCVMEGRRQKNLVRASVPEYEDCRVGDHVERRYWRQL